MSLVRQQKRKAGDGGAPAINLGWRGLAVRVFVIFHLVVIFVWALPVQGGPVAGVREVVAPYMLWTGLFQSWDTFAPEPAGVNSFVKAIAMSENNEVQVFALPRVEEMGLAERYRRERYRKFAEVLPDPKFAAVWPGVAAKVKARYSTAQDPTEQVLLMNFVDRIGPESLRPHAPMATDTDYKPEMFYQEHYLPDEAAGGQRQGAAH